MVDVCGGAGVAHADGEDVNVCIWPLTADNVGQRGIVVVADELCGVREASIGTVLSFHNLNLSN
jgi:hypothetical protein